MESTQLMAKDFFFCTNKKIMKHLRYENNIPFILSAIDKFTSEEFWLFERSELLNSALDDLK